MTDPIADILIRIKNGYQAQKEIVEIPYSRLKQAIGEILAKEGFLASCQVKTLKNRFKVLSLGLKYDKKTPALTNVKRISKPGLRVYAPANKIPPVKYGFGITIVSTPKGLMTGSEAKKKHLGGEIIGQIW